MIIEFQRGAPKPRSKFKWPGGLGFLAVHGLGLRVSDLGFRVLRKTPPFLSKAHVGSHFPRGFETAVKRATGYWALG